LKRPERREEEKFHLCFGYAFRETPAEGYCCATQEFLMVPSAGGGKTFYRTSSKRENFVVKNQKKTGIGGERKRQTNNGMQRHLQEKEQIRGLSI